VARIILSFTIGGRIAERISLSLTPFGIVLAGAIAVQVGREGKPVLYEISGLPPPQHRLAR
jgi:hypothetical protein